VSDEDKSKFDANSRQDHGFSEDRMQTEHINSFSPKSQSANSKYFPQYSNKGESKPLLNILHKKREKSAAAGGQRKSADGGTIVVSQFLTKNPTQTAGAVLKSRASSISQNHQQNKRIILSTSQTINKRAYKEEKKSDNLLQLKSDHVKTEKRPLSVEQMQRILGHEQTMTLSNASAV
jgi:hypothetical protein